MTVRRAATAFDRLAAWWWLFYLGFVSLFLGGAVAAPLLAMAGFTRASNWIYLAYRVSCHQLPHHSWFLGGPRASYGWEALQPLTSFGVGQAATAFHHPIRDAAVGFQMAICQRDTAIWGILLLTSFVLVWRSRRQRMAALPIWAYALAAMPMAVDALTQLVGWRESTPLLRTLTGGLFGMATALLVVPLLDEGVRELREG